MANWTHKLELKDLHDKHENGEITVEELSKEVAKRLRALCAQNTPPIPVELLEEAEDIAQEFEDLPEDTDEYDYILGKLYDWADTPLPTGRHISFSQQPRLCWVNTF
jgi:septation ring formation regulator EzrA